MCKDDDAGFPVGRRLSELPGFEAYLAEHRRELTPEGEAIFRGWQLIIEAERLESPEPFTDLFDYFLHKTKDLEALPPGPAVAAPVGTKKVG